MERFNYGSLEQMRAESVELVRLLNIEAMGKPSDG